MIKIMAGVANYHNPAFIVLAFIVCFVGFFAAISLFVRAVNFGITQQPNRIISSAIVAGPTLWATFFIAFLGLDSGSRILHYGIPVTAGSIIIGVFASWTAFRIQPKRAWLSGLAFGTGACVIDIAGISSLIAPTQVNWNSAHIFAVMAVGLAGPAIAFRSSVQSRDVYHRAVAVLLLVIAIAVLHFTAASAISADRDSLDVVSVTDRYGMAAAATAITLLMGLAGMSLERYFARRETRRQDRLRADILALDEAHQRLSATATSLQNALAPKSTTNQATENFLAMMSQELRPPLKAVIGFSDMMRQQVLGPIGNENYLEYAGNIYESGEHLLRIISDILDVANVEAGHLHLNEEAVDLHLLIQKATRLAESAAARGHILLGDAFEPSLPLLRIDEQRTLQILVSLLNSSIERSPAGSLVTVSASRTGTGLSIVVGNTADKNHANPDSDGNGMVYDAGETSIGLVLSEKLMELHGGSLVVDSTSGSSVTTITFPPERLIEQLGTRKPALAGRHRAAPA